MNTAYIKNETYQDINHTQIITTKPGIFLLSMSNCEPCKKVKTYLKDRGIPFDFIDADIAEIDEWDRAYDIIGENMPSIGEKMIFPMIYFDGILVYQGFSKLKLDELIRTELF